MKPERIDHKRTAEQQVWSQRPGLTTGSGGVAGGVSQHAINDTDIHLGTLDDDQATQFLLLDGTRAMQAALNMNTYAITSPGNVDGVDVGSPGHGIEVDSNVYRIASEAAGDGLDGGAGSALSVDVTDLLGSGLTETGNDIDLDWGTPTIGTIEPDDAANAGTSTNPARSDHQHAIVAAAASTLSVSTTNGEGSATSFARSDHTHTITTTADGAANHSTILQSGGSGELTLDDLTLESLTASRLLAGGAAKGLASVGDLTSWIGGTANRVTVADDGDGSVTLSAPQDLHTGASPEFDGLTLTGDFDPYRVTDHLLPKTTDTYDLGSSTLLWRKGYLSEMEAVLFAENTITLLGGWFYITKYAGTAGEDIDGSETSIDLDATDGEMAAGDFIIFRQSLKVEYMTLVSYDGANVWTVTRDTDGSGANTWPEGAPYACFGQEDDGRIELNAYDTPRISILKHGATYNAQTELIRLGDLNGLADYASENYGIFIGDYSGDKWMAYDETNSLRIRGDALIDGTVDATKFSVGMQDNLFSASDGLLLLGPDCPITSTSWTSLRGQEATISGAFHRVAGAWAGTQALMVEEATTNEVGNPLFEDDTSGWTTGDATLTRDTSQSFVGDASGKLVDTAGSEFSNCRYDVTISGDTAGRTFTVQARVKATTSGGIGESAKLCVQELGGAEATATSTGDSVTLSAEWQYLEEMYTIVQSDRTTVRLLLYFETADVDDFMFVDAAQMEEKGIATSFCANALDWCSGTGTTHTRTATEVNLDDYASLLSDNNTWALSLWWQPQYDADEDWPIARLFAAKGSGSARIYVEYDDGSDKYRVYINGAIRFTSSVQSFSAGDNQHVVLAFDFSNNTFTLYINGVLDTTSIVGLASPTLTQLNLGSDYTGANQSNAPYSELALFDSVLTAEEVAAIYQRNAPLVDAGAFDTPGVYILDGRFGLATSTGGGRVQIDADGFEAYSDATTQTVGVETDGDLFAGSDISAAATTALAVFASAQTYNSESVGAGDVLMGDNSASKANVLWDKSAGQIKFRGGTDTEAYIDTDGAITAGGGDVTLNSAGLFFAEGSSYENGLVWRQSGSSWASQIYTSIADDGGTETATLYLKAPYDSGGSIDVGVIDLSAVAPLAGAVSLQVDGSIGAVTIDQDLRVGAGLYVGATDQDPDADDIHYDGNLKSVKSSTAYDVYAFHPLDSPATSTSWDGDAKSGASGTIDLSSVFSLPANIKAVAATLSIGDEDADVYASLGPSSSHKMAILCRTQVAGAIIDAGGVCPCDSSGDIYFYQDGELDTVYIRIWGYWI